MTNTRARIVAESIALCIGLAALLWAWRADLNWFWRHNLWVDGAPTAADAAHAWSWRIAGAALGLAFIFVVRPFVGRWAARVGGGRALGSSARAAVAIALALAASEGILRLTHLPKHHVNGELTEVRIGVPDTRYGWLYAPSRATTLTHGGRPIEYAINADHNRARSISSVPDRARPTLLVAGESITAGHGLEWDETYAALVGHALDLQVVNLAVHGYGADQAYLRLYDALPTFERPVVVLSFFIPAVVLRLTLDQHPHIELDGLEPRVVPSGFFHDLHVVDLARGLFPYRGDDVYELAAHIFRATEKLARDRGAQALFVAPRYGPRLDQHLIDELFTRQGLPVLDFDYETGVLPGDTHPDAAATRRLADAIVTALRAKVSSR